MPDFEPTSNEQEDRIIYPAREPITIKYEDLFDGFNELGPGMSDLEFGKEE